jgi:hypothetical protein
MEVMEELGLLEGEHFKYYQGTKFTATVFYKTLHDNRESLFIFDDSDTVLQNGDIILMLKAALDSGTGERRVGYESPAIENMGLEPNFVFTGQIIFISNLSMAAVDQALISRSFSADVSMTRSETFERMQHIIDKNPEEPELPKFPYPRELMQKGFDIITNYDKKHPGKPKDLNMRTLLKIVKLLSSGVPNAEEVAEYALSVS